MSNCALRCSFLALILWNLPGFAQSQVPKSQFIPNRYTLVLSDPPVADRFASREALATAQADTYRRQIETAQAQVKSALAARNIRVLGSVSLLENAIFVEAPASSVAALQSIPGVAAVKPVRRMKLLLNRATTLANAPAAWTAVGGQSSAGAGIKIGVIDTGIDQTHPALQDSSLSTPSGFPKGVTGYTTNKVIVARSYVSLLTTTNPASSTPDDFSPRDRIGHGTFNAVIAAGNLGTSTPASSTTGGPITISGMAPKAWLGNYKIAGSPGVDEFASDQVLIAAVNDAVSDGMDVITCSVGSLANSDAASDPVAAAFEKATQYAVVVASAGDAGNDSYYAGFNYPGFNTIASPSNAADVISVGATINSHVLLPTVSVNGSGAPSSLQGMPAAVGDSYFYPSGYGASHAPLVDVANLDGSGLACSALPSGSLTGSYALILRGTCTFDAKAANAQTAGAIGFVYYMATSGASVSPEGINENGPSVMLSNGAGLALKSYVDANAGAMVTIDLNGAEQDLTTWNVQPCVDPTSGACPAITPTVVANQFASYSSMGPTPDGQLKPDVVAPGGLDSALTPNSNDDYIYPPSGFYSATQSYDPNQAYDVNVFSANRYAAGDGSSFSAPLVAGAAALVKQAHASLRPTQIKSLLVNYAAQNTATDDFGDQVDAQWIGAGDLNAGAAVAANVTAEPSTISFGILNSASLPIAKTITLTNISSGSISLNATVSCCSVNGSPNGTLSGATVAASPTSVTLAAGATATLTVTLSGSKPAVGEYSGNVVLQNSSTTMRIPFMLLEGQGTVYNVLPFIGGEGVPGEDVGPAAVQLTDVFGVPVVDSNVTFSVSPRGTLTLQSVSGAPACSPASSTTTITCPTDQFGYAYVETVNGSSAASPTLNYSASGLTGSGSYNIQAAPFISSASVVDATSFSKSPVAPGSYVNIYGTGMSNYTDTNDHTTDALSADGTYDTLPLHIDFVTVTFDVPSANISVPAGVTYVSPGVVQIQVPWEVEGQSSAQMKVVLDGDLFGNAVSVPLANYAPEFFTNGNNIADALDQNYALITTSHAAVRGQSISLFANGLGPVTNPPASGAPALSNPLSQTTQQVTVSFGGTPATPSFAGLAPGYPGLYQINVVVPTGATTGSAVPVTISVGGVTSGQATLPIQ